MVVDGNEMCAAAAIFAGCQFFGGYPITPSSEIMHFLAREIWKYGGTMLQAEDEIAGIGACVGASFAGKKVMTATSGPGMSLKTEMLGLASIAELPLVCVNVQRGGPSTGIPTKSEQSDLFQACFSAHGDVVRPVLAPTSVADTFAVTVEAFNVAEEYQTPVILLSDQEIAQRKETVDPIDTAAFQVVERLQPTGAELEKYVRFKFTDSGVSPISHPGMAGGNYLASGIEHNERGAPTASGEMHARMNEKRIRKLDPLKHRRDLFLREGDPHAPLALVAWGSLAGAAQRGARDRAARGHPGEAAGAEAALPGGGGGLRRVLPQRPGAGWWSSSPTRDSSTGSCACTWTFRRGVRVAGAQRLEPDPAAHDRRGAEAARPARCRADAWRTWNRPGRSRDR